MSLIQRLLAPIERLINHRFKVTRLTHNASACGSWIRINYNNNYESLDAYHNIFDIFSLEHTFLSIVINVLFYICRSNKSRISNTIYAWRDRHYIWYVTLARQIYFRLNICLSCVVSTREFLNQYCIMIGTKRWVGIDVHDALIWWHAALPIIWHCAFTNNDRQR